MTNNNNLNLNTISTQREKKKTKKQTQTMKLFFISIVLFSVVLASAQGPAMSPVDGESPAEAPMSMSDDCFDSFLNMSDCLTFVEKGSNLTKPEKGCCPALAGLVESKPICLCQLLGNSSSIAGVEIDVSKALALPKSCTVTTPPVSLCAAIGVPVGVPTASEGPGSSASGGGMSPAMTPNMGPPAPPGSGAPNIRSISLVVLLGLSGVIVAILL